MKKLNSYTSWYQVGRITRRPFLNIAWCKTSETFKAPQQHIISTFFELSLAKRDVAMYTRLHNFIIESENISKKSLLDIARRNMYLPDEFLVGLIHKHGATENCPSSLVQQYMQKHLPVAPKELLTARPSSTTLTPRSSVLLPSRNLSNSSWSLRRSTSFHIRYNRNWVWHPEDPGRQLSDCGVCVCVGCWFFESLCSVFFFRMRLFPFSHFPISHFPIFPLFHFSIFSTFPFFHFSTFPFSTFPTFPTFPFFHFSIFSLPTPYTFLKAAKCFPPK